MDFKNIEIIVSEVDGIITDDRNSTDTMNNILFKNYCAKDFDIINVIKPYYTVVFLVEDPTISYGVMRSKNIPFYFTKNKYELKVDILSKILNKYNTTPEHLLYIGSRMSDIECMHLSEFSVVANDSISPLRTIANYVSPAQGGHGVIASVYDLFMVNPSTLNS